MEDQGQGVQSSRPQSKTTLTELLDTLKLLEGEPEGLPELRVYHKEKYAWIDQVRVQTFRTFFTVKLQAITDPTLNCVS